MEKPWKAKVDEPFYCVDTVTMKTRHGDAFGPDSQAMMIRGKNAFRTEKEAKAALKEIKLFFKGI